MKIVSETEAISILRNGGVGVLPTDTVYGLVACANNPEAVARLYALKHRERKPGTIIAASVEQLIELGVEERYLHRVEKWWPASLSVETPLGAQLAYLHQDTGRQGVRVAADERVRRILKQTGPLATSSANQPGKPHSNTVREAFEHFEDTVDFYVDGGDLSTNAPSTLIKISPDNTIEVIRQGAVRID